ncbi:MAG TPA: thioredoxin domain-containing protein [Polyangiaceae bacterium]|nr:thioredoxin domain-containing protein [Polyangiaceae bacterium]
MSSLPELAAGTVFASDYKIERLLARGGMGAVYVAEQLSTGRQRALKLMHPMLTGDESLRRRFEQEAKVGSRIKSSHVVEVIAAGVDAASGMPWLAMELLEGEDLGHYVERLGARPLAEVAEILSQICHALGAAHDVGVVHRDLKPENVFLARSLQQGSPTLVKLLDLGIAKIVAEASPKQTASVGTPLWMAPEQMGGSVGPQADVWALGLLAFWLLTGRHYWRAASSIADGSLMAVLREVAAEPLEPASVRSAALGVSLPLPAGFDAWFERAVTREPAMRFANATQAAQAFQSVVAGVAQTLLVPSSLQVVGSSPSGSVPTAFAPTITVPGAALTPPPAQRRGWVPVALLGVAVVGLGGFLAVRGGHDPAASPVAATRASAPVVTASAAVASASAVPSAAPPVARQAGNLDDPNLVWKVPLGDSPVRGAADAPVTIVEFANYQCPYTRGAEPEIKALLAELGDKVRLVWKDDPLAVHTQAELAATVAREARAELGDAGFWAAHDRFLTPDFRPTDATLHGAAKDLGLDANKVAHALAERPYTEQIATDADLADDLKTVGTPYFFVNGRRVVASGSLAKVRAIVKEELAKTEKLVESGVPRDKIYEHLMESARGAQPLELKVYDFASATIPTRGQGLVMMVEFCDYKNFLCKLVDPLVDELLKKFPQDMGVAWVEPDHYVSDESRKAAIAARAAYRSGGVAGFDRYRRLLFETQSQGFGGKKLELLATAAGLDLASYRQVTKDPEVFGELDREALQSKSAGVHDVPAFLVCGPDYCKSGGYFLSGGQPRRAFEKRVRLVLAAKGGELPASP